MTGRHEGRAEATGDGAVHLTRNVHDQLLEAVRQRHPHKSFGYLLAEADSTTVTDFVLFESNVRNDDRWRPAFEARGEYFVAHDDAGFVAAPEESWQLQKQIWERGLIEVGVFHSHRRHPGNFSGIDYELHLERFDELWHLIISMRNPAQPQLRAFAVSRAGVRELAVLVPGQEDAATPAAAGPGPRPLDLDEVRSLLRLDSHGRPAGPDARAVLGAIEALHRAGDQGAIAEIVDDGFLRDSGARYEQHVAPHMRSVAGARFKMGSDTGRVNHFCGESPAHAVELSPYLICELAVTNDLFALLDRGRAGVPAAERTLPATWMTWFEATLFALWMGCRLPTEAEWEYACGAAAPSPWCCEDERSLGLHAWYSENARDVLHAVGARAPNRLGLFDLHGNVWEWCGDAYDAGWYARSPRRDPVCAGATGADRVCRGGSIFSLAEMCRTRFRLYEPPGFRAGDLGLRLARSAGTAGEATA